jgi:hypothetical protein
MKFYLLRNNATYYNYYYYYYYCYWWGGTKSLGTAATSGLNAMYSAGSHPTFRRNMQPPFTVLKNKPGKKPTAICSALVSCLTYSITLKNEARNSSETSVDFFNELHDVMSQKIPYYIFVRRWDGGLLRNRLLILNNILCGVTSSFPDKY